jgi:hypothetical protein
MDDKTYADLKLKATICPEQVRWPTQFTHWQKLHGAVDEARQRVSETFAAMDAINADANLSATGKADACRKLAEKALAEAKESKTLEHAQAAVERMQERWANKLSEIIKPAEDPHGVALHAQIRDRVAALSKEDRLMFLTKHGDDPLVASALLLAPPFLSNITDAEAAMIRAKMERIALSPEIIEARDATSKALAAAEKGWGRAISLIAQRGKIVPEDRMRAVA